MFLRFLTCSPLTPALSPLRGEGVALVVRLFSQARRRILPRWRHDSVVSTAAKDDVCVEAVCRAPSPLNGERAGVRGEYQQQPSLSARTPPTLRLGSQRSVVCSIVLIIAGG